MVVSSVLWCCWLGGRKGIRPVENWAVGCCRGYLSGALERGADLHMAQLMPLPLTVSCFSKIQIGFTFLVLAQPGSPGQRSVKWVFCLFSWLCNEIDWFIVMVKVKCADIAVRILSCHRNSHAIWDPAVLPATRQRWHSRLYPSRSWYSIKRWPTCPYPFFIHFWFVAIIICRFLVCQFQCKHAGITVLVVHRT